MFIYRLSYIYIHTHTNTRKSKIYTKVKKDWLEGKKGGVGVVSVCNVNATIALVDRVGVCWGGVMIVLCSVCLFEEEEEEVN